LYSVSALYARLLRASTALRISIGDAAYPKLTIFLTEYYTVLFRIAQYIVLLKDVRGGSASEVSPRSSASFFGGV
jgi:hypothetical protein